MPLLTTPADWQPLLFLLQHPIPVYAVLKLSMLKVFSANRLPSLKAGLVYISLFTLFSPHQNSLIYFLPSFIEPSHGPLLNGMTLLYIPHNSLESSPVTFHICHTLPSSRSAPLSSDGQRLDNKLY